MLWRVRTTLPDRPGALAVLARTCGVEGVNILGLQIFPGIGAVTDELVLRTPEGWGLAEIVALLEASGGQAVSVVPCTEAALSDQPTRYVQAARTILASPTSFPEVVSRLFDTEPDPVPGGHPQAQDVMDMSVGDVLVQLRRTAPFTATEHVRGSALADLVSDVLAQVETVASGVSESPTVLGETPTYVADGGSVSAVVGSGPVGSAHLTTRPDEPGVLHVDLRVEVVWRRRGIGTRLLVEAARLAQAQGADEIVVTTRFENPAALPLVLASGLRGRIRLAADVLTVRVAVRELRPSRT